MRYYTLKHYSSKDRRDLYTRSKDDKIMLFPSREDAEAYRDAYYGRWLVHEVVPIDIEEIKAEEHQLMTAIHDWETRGQQ